MARPLRIEFAGAVYHVTARGNECKAIFRDDRDREYSLEILAAARSLPESSASRRSPWPEPSHGYGNG